MDKKELQEDQLVDSFAHLIDFYKKNQSKIIATFSAVVVIIVALVGYTNYMVSQNKEANGKLSKVLRFYNGADYNTAIEGRNGEFEGLTKIVSDYGSTEAGQIAKIYLANSLLRTGKIDEAFDMYDDFSGNKKLFIAAAKAGKAACKEVKKEYDLAGNLYKSAFEVTENNPLNSEYLLKAGKAYLKAGKKEQAKAMFLKIKDEFAGTASFSEADRYLNGING
ncbi:MAG: tol-pal system YbgF family protein [Rhodothermaceae bacterium]